MRRILTGLLIISQLVFCTSRGLCTDYTQDANCQGAWLFTEGSGTTVDDSSANNNIINFKGIGEPAWASMSGTNAPTYDDYMVDFDKVNDYMVVTDNDNLDLRTHDLTVVGWISTTITSNARIINKKIDTVSPYLGWVLETVATTGKLLGGFRWNSSHAAYSTSNTAVNSGDWVHIGMTIDFGNVVQLYVNGNADGNSVSCSGSTDTNAGTNLYFGRRCDQATNYFADYMAEFAIFDKLLTSTEINDIMDNGLKGGGVAFIEPCQYGLVN